MSRQNEGVTLADEIIDNASMLPIECQDMLLAIAKGMRFTRSCIEKQEQKLDKDSLCKNEPLVHD